MLEYDVVVISDFRLPGGTNNSTAEELSVHRELGVRTGLIHCNSRLSSRPRVWSDAILSALEPDLIEPILPGHPVHARLAVIRHPIAIEALPEFTSSLSVDRAIVIANQTAVSPNGKFAYNAATINAKVIDQLGVAPLWAPIGPVVRSSLDAWGLDIDIMDEDWTNIFADQSPPTPRHGFNRSRPTIGRHSRPQRDKWPDNAADILAAYPASGHYNVKILGGAKPAQDVLGKIPASWRVYEFGELPPREFLAQIDFWVYFHHPQWREAYGRAIMEALRSGAVVILPEYLRATYGDAAVYGTPKEVVGIIESFRTGEREFLSQSARAQAFAAAHSPELHSARLRKFLGWDAAPRLTESGGLRDATAQIIVPPKFTLTNASPVPATRHHMETRPRALFLTSNGAGMGHLTRMLGMARATADTLQPIFFSMSQGLSVAEKAGFAAEYVPFSSAIQTKSPEWHRYFEDRLAVAIEQYDAEALVFDGTWPYRGLLATLNKYELFAVWVRRGMWKPSISPEQLSVGAQFDLILEPGDYAAEFDTGATSRVNDAHRVSPMTLLRQEEVLSREEARRELGLSTSGDARYALVTLGAGNINDFQATQEQFVRAIESMPGWKALLTHVPIAANRAATRAGTIVAYPLARHMNAFDYAVSAAGYNSFTEWMAGALPTIWVPNLQTQTDDQDARARWAEARGLGLRITSSSPIEIWDAVHKMSRDEWRSELRDRMGALPDASGAEEAARILRSTWNRRSHVWRWRR